MISKTFSETITKKYYSIGEVAQMFNMSASALRFWVAFMGMEVKKNGWGKFYFTPCDIENIGWIYRQVRAYRRQLREVKELLKEQC